MCSSVYTQVYMALSRGIYPIPKYPQISKVLCICEGVKGGICRESHDTKTLLVVKGTFSCSWRQFCSNNGIRNTSDTATEHSN